MLYLKTNIVDFSAIEDLRFDGDTVGETTAKISGKTAYLPQIRSTTLKLIDPKNFPDISASILKALKQFDSSIDIDEYQATEFNYLRYNKGDHFKKHKDVVGSGNPRIYTTVTLIKKSDDLVGGDLLIWDKDNNEHKIDLKVGETVLFKSTSFHQVTPVESGTRESLVVWISKNPAYLR